MLSGLTKKKLKLVNGGKCYCCCLRNPYIEGYYKGVAAGETKDEQKCVHKCTSDLKHYNGFMNCAPNSFNCSILPNDILADEILYFRKIFGVACPEIDVGILRKK